MSGNGTSRDREDRPSSATTALGTRTEETQIHIGTHRIQSTATTRQQRQPEFDEQPRPSRDAERVRIGRNRETSEQRRARRSDNANRDRIRRWRESSEERRVRLSRVAERTSSRREEESAEQRQARLSRTAERVRTRRERESSEQRTRRQSGVATRARARRRQESSEEGRTRHLQNAESGRARRERESSEQRRTRLSQGTESGRARRERESSEQRRARLSQSAESGRARRERESSEQRRARLSQSAESGRARRERESSEQRRARLSHSAESGRARRERESSEQRRSRLSQNVESGRARRGRESSEQRRARLSEQALRTWTRTTLRGGRLQRTGLPAANTDGSPEVGSGEQQVNIRDVAARERRIGRSSGVPEEHYDGPMNVECRSCGALHFRSERKPGRSTFNDCCNHGSITLQHFSNFPALLQRLFTSQDMDAKEFREHIRSYNSAFAFASIGAQLKPSRRGPYCYRIHGQIYHKIGPARPDVGQSPRYGQVYILDTAMAAEERAGHPANVNCNPITIGSLTVLMHELNAFAQAYKMLNEVALEEEARAIREQRSAMPVKMVFETSNMDPRRYNEPTANEIAVVYVGEEGDVPAQHSLAVHLQSGGLRDIRVYEPECDPLSYPLLFPRGELGWHPNMQKNRQRGTRTRITQKEYYSNMIAVRTGFNPLHLAGKLYQQFLVDSYVKIEQNRLNYDRTHQRELRVDTYRGLADYVAGDLDIAGPPGTKKIILPSSFPGSPRAMVQNYQDAMAIVSKYGKPDLFITFTCNPTWREITEQLRAGQTASDRPDIVARVFHIKLRELFVDLLKRHIFGRVIAYISVMEWQKRGLPHCHALLTLAEEDKPRSGAEVDSIVQAVIPDPQTEPRLHRIVTTCMMHRPCGPERPDAPCMVKGQCSKRYPKAFRDITNMDLDGYPEYRRPNDGRTVLSGDTVLDNRSVVPYNKYLALRYNGHLNVEICALIHAVKYMYKYVYKGPDRASLRMLRTAGDGEDRVVNEIDAFVNARYVCAPEATHRLLGFDLQSKSDTVYRLQVHLPEQESVTFHGGEEQEALLRAAQQDTTLTAYFKLNAEHEAVYGTGDAPEGEVDARTLHYIQLPEHFTFSRQKKWASRKRRGRQIGRMYTANPLDMERYSLRILLLNKKGAKSFEDLKTVNGSTYNTFKETAIALGLMHDDSHYDSCLAEAAEYQMPEELRSLFSSVICFCDITNPERLWQQFKSAMSEDYVHRGMSNDEAVNRAYFDVFDRMQLSGKDLSTLIAPPVDGRPAYNVEHRLSEEEHIARGAEMFAKLNTEQSLAAHNILQNVDEGHTARNFFIDGPGGSGKTFLYTALYHTLIGRGKKVICVAWTGIAANLLPHGRTASSTFKLNIHDGSKTSTMKREATEARVLRDISVIFWDEISMVPKWTMEAVDLLLRDVMQNEQPFGGKLMIVGGDFRQVLPVIERGRQEDLENACIKNSYLWQGFVTYHLSVNMRATSDDDEWARMLLKIGEGRYEEDGNGFIRLPPTLYSTGDLISDVYGETIAVDDIAELAHKAILAPKNVHVAYMNELALQRMPENLEVKIYKSVDEAENADPADAFSYQVEHLNKLLPSGMPPHELKLKKGCIVMLLRNLDVSSGLCNGTRLIVDQLGRYVLGCRFATGNRVNQFVLIPRIDNYTDKELPFRLRRRQFPIRLAFATTINKAQGQTLSKVGIYLPDDVFSHGQLYVALSRAKNSDSVRILSPKPKLRNIVYKSVL